MIFRKDIVYFVENTIFIMPNTILKLFEFCELVLIN